MLSICTYSYDCNGVRYDEKPPSSISNCLVTYVTRGQYESCRMNISLVDSVLDPIPAHDSHFMRIGEYSTNIGNSQTYTFNNTRVMNATFNANHNLIWNQVNVSNTQLYPGESIITNSILTNCDLGYNTMYSIDIPPLVKISDTKIINSTVRLNNYNTNIQNIQLNNSKLYLSGRNVTLFETKTENSTISGTYDPIILKSGYIRNSDIDRGELFEEMQLVNSTIRSDNLTMQSSNMDKGKLFLYGNLIIRNSTINNAFELEPYIHYQVGYPAYQVSTKSFQMFNTRVNGYFAFTSKGDILLDNVTAPLGVYITCNDCKSIVVKNSPNLSGNLYYKGTSNVELCQLNNTNFRIDQSAIKLYPLCGQVYMESFIRNMVAENILFIVLTITFVSAILYKLVQRKVSIKPILTLFASTSSFYSLITRSMLLGQQSLWTTVALSTLVISQIALGVVCAWKLARIYGTKYPKTTFVLSVLNPGNLELLWSKFMKLEVFSHEVPNKHIGILGWLKYSRSYLQDILLMYLFILRNPVTTYLGVVKIFNSHTSFLMLSISSVSKPIGTIFGLLYISELIVLILFTASGAQVDVLRSAYALVQCFVSLSTAAIVLNEMKEEGTKHKRYKLILKFFLGGIVAMSAWAAFGIWGIIIIDKSTVLYPFGVYLSFITYSNQYTEIAVSLILVVGVLFQYAYLWRSIRKVNKTVKQNSKIAPES